MWPVREGAGYDAPLIDMLTERRIPATFFLSGRWITKHEAEVKALLTVPFFEVGTHGQVHAHLPALDADHQRAEISRPVLTLQKRYGYRGLLFRPPYGEYDDTTVEIVQALGLQVILWSAVSGDPDSRLSPDRMLEDLHKTLPAAHTAPFPAHRNRCHT